MDDLHLTGLHIYPIKSMGGISMDSTRTEGRGFPFDRRWMLVDENGKFISQRTNPGMALFSVDLDGEHLIVTHAGESLHINVETEVSGSKEINLWASSFPAPLAIDHYNKWFSSHLSQACYLVVMKDSVRRPVSEKYAIDQDLVSFADGFPYLIIGENSLNDLNARLETPLPMNRFRPNIVFSGGLAFEEDTWDTFRVGEALFKAVKPCGRCMITTIDQETGIKGQEPLATLARFRKSEGNVLFGWNLLCMEHGRLQTGDKISVLTRK